MRVCKCGGHIRQHELTKNREAWTCNECGRYEVIAKGESTPDIQIVKKEDQKQESVQP